MRFLVGLVTLGFLVWLLGPLVLGIIRVMFSVAPIVTLVVVVIILGCMKRKGRASWYK
ncbi:MAG: hypothetical protein LBP21_03705 [Synergistaceae bacterium]|nr:hypothetical protein [Synergistaceae bacterium]